jgi:peptidoglycan/LPS O-acetylase OafA/YrhL
VLVHVVKESPETLGGIPRDIASNGWVAVSLFFILSGFILAYTYLDAQGSSRLDRRSFWVARFARIYPAYFLALLLSMPHFLNSLFETKPLPSALVHAVVGTVAATGLVQSWSAATAYLINSPGWSLSDEAFFYLLFPFLGVAIARLSRRWLLATIGLLYAAYLIPPAAFWLLRLPWDPWATVTYVNPLLRLPEFLIGVAAGILFLRREPSSVDPGKSLALTVVAGLGIVAVMAAAQPLTSLLAIQGTILHNVLLTPLFVAIIYFLAHGQGPIVRFLSLPVIVLLGEASYALYILQQPVLDWGKTIATRLDIVDPQSSVFIWTYVVVVVGISVATLLLWENPARRAIRRRLTPSSTTTTVDFPPMVERPDPSQATPAA